MHIRREIRGDGGGRGQGPGDDQQVHATAQHKGQAVGLEGQESFVLVMKAPVNPDFSRPLYQEWFNMSFLRRSRRLFAGGWSKNGAAGFGDAICFGGIQNL